MPRGPLRILSWYKLGRRIFRCRSAFAIHSDIWSTSPVPLEGVFPANFVVALFSIHTLLKKYMASRVYKYYKIRIMSISISVFMNSLRTHTDLEYQIIIA